MITHMSHSIYMHINIGNLLGYQMGQTGYKLNKKTARFPRKFACKRRYVVKQNIDTNVNKWWFDDKITSGKNIYHCPDLWKCLQQIIENTFTQVK